MKNDSLNLIYNLFITRIQVNKHLIHWYKMSHNSLTICNALYFYLVVLIILTQMFCVIYDGICMIFSENTCNTTFAVYQYSQMILHK